MFEDVFQRFCLGFVANSIGFVRGSGCLVSNFSVIELTSLVIELVLQERVPNCTCFKCHRLVLDFNNKDTKPSNSSLKQKVFAETLKDKFCGKFTHIHLVWLVTH